MKAHNRAARRPAFFMLGAPKCVTTALASHLATHPLIRVSEPKEPNYLCKGLRVGSRFGVRRRIPCDDFPGFDELKTHEASPQNLPGV